MNISTVSDMVVSARHRALVKYEDYLPDTGDVSRDRTYLRAFEREFRSCLDGMVSSSADNIVILDDRVMGSSEPDARSALSMAERAEMCFPRVFIKEEELRGMGEDGRHRYLVERMYAGGGDRPDKWAKYNKGKIKGGSRT